MNRTDSPLTALQRDKRLRWMYYRPYVVAGALTFLVVLAVSVQAERLTVLREKDWKEGSLQQAEATCLRSYPMSTSQPVLVDERWVNTYQIHSEQRTVSSPESCIVGKPYRLQYRMSKSGRFALKAQTVIDSLPGK